MSDTALPSRHTPTFSSVAHAVKEELECFEKELSSVLKDFPSPIKEVCNHLVFSGGKRVRPTLLFLCSEISNSVTSKEIETALCVELIHSATLLHDDVIDRSDTRRGKPAAHKLWSQNHSILAGDFLLCKALDILAHVESWEALQHIQRTSCSIVLGQTKELLPSSVPIAEQEKRYLEIIYLKTASLFETSAMLPCILANNKKHLSTFQSLGHSVGMCFQLVDDFLDYCAPLEKTGKPKGQDFKEKKITLPLIFAYKKSTPAEQAFIDRALQAASRESGVFEEIQAIIHKNHGFMKMREVIKEELKKAENAIQQLPDHPIKGKLLDFTLAVESQASL